MMMALMRYALLVIVHVMCVSGVRLRSVRVVTRLPCGGIIQQRVPVSVFKNIIKPQPQLSYVLHAIQLA